MELVHVDSTVAGDGCPMGAVVMTTKEGMNDSWGHHSDVGTISNIHISIRWNCQTWMWEMMTVVLVSLQNSVTLNFTKYCPDSQTNVFNIAIINVSNKLKRNSTVLGFSSSSRILPFTAYFECTVFSLFNNVSDMISICTVYSISWIIFPIFLI